MKFSKLFLSYLVSLCLIGTVQAVPALIFSNVGGGAAWTATKTAADTVQIDFDNIWVDWSEPADPYIIHDIIDIPTMTFLLTDSFTVTIPPGITLTTYYGLLTPAPGAKFAIIDNVDGIKMTADIAPNGLYAIAADYGAYTNQTTDLTNLDNKDPGYSATIDQLVAAEAAGLLIDISFSGSALGNPTLFELIDTGNIGDTATGTLSGQINVIPEPATVSLFGLAALALISKRKRI